MTFMKANLANMLRQRLPYTAEVEYLQSTGTQWIDLGIKLTQEYSAIIEFEMTENTQGYATVFGARNSAGNRALDFQRGHTNDSFYQSFDGIGGSYAPVISMLRARHVAETGQVFKIDGYTVKTFTGYSSFTTAQTAKLFGFHWEGGAGVQSASKMRCYSLVVKRLGQVVMDLIPVHVDGVGCMYDRVNPDGGSLGNGLYMNSGTGNFIVGYPPVPIRTYDSQVEYLQSTGTQWIDTNVQHDSANAVRFKLKMPTGSNTYIGTYADYVGEQYRTTRIIWRGSLRTNLLVYHGTVAESQGVVISNAVSSNGIVEGYTSAQGHMVNGISAAAQTPQAGKAANTVKLLYSNSDYSYASGSRVYYFKIDNQCDFIPVRFTNELGQTEGAMYDRVTKRLFRNQGTGSFVIGPDITTGGSL